MSEGGGFAAAYSHFEAGRLQDAHRICHQVLAADPNHIDALHLIGFIALQTGQPQDAVQAVSRAIAINGRLPDLHNMLGEALRGLGRVNEAIACCRRALALAPNNATTHGCLGNALLQQGQAEEAAACYVRAVALQPGDAALHYGVERSTAFHRRRRTAQMRSRSSYGSRRSINAATFATMDWGNNFFKHCVGRYAEILTI